MVYLYPVSLEENELEMAQVRLVMTNKVAYFLLSQVSRFPSANNLVPDEGACASECVEKFHH